MGWVPTGGSGAIFTFSAPHTLAVSQGAARLYPPTALTIKSVRASVGIAPAGDSILVDVNKDGTTVFTTQANRPEIAAAGYLSDQETPDVTAWATTEYLTVDVDQVGSTTPGAHLTVVVECE